MQIKSKNKIIYIINYADEDMNIRLEKQSFVSDRLKANNFAYVTFNDLDITLNKKIISPWSKLLRVLESNKFPPDLCDNEFINNLEKYLSTWSCFL